MAQSEDITTLRNLTGQLVVLNLAPLQEQQLYLPPHGQVNVHTADLAAPEIQALLKCRPPRLAALPQKSPDTQPSAAPSAPGANP